MDLAALRLEYGRAGLDEEDLAPDPITMFERWMSDAVDAGVHEPNGMVVATADASGTPSARMVLLKGIGPAGFVKERVEAFRESGVTVLNVVPLAATTAERVKLIEQLRNLADA